MREIEKVQSEFIKRQYESGVDNYVDFTTQIGLWESEKYVFQKYLKFEHKILDLGCGTGRTTFPLYNSGYSDIVGIDLTPCMIQNAKELNKHFQCYIEFSIGDATNLEFENSLFDAVIFSFNGLMSIPMASSRVRAVRQICRVLKNRGIFIFTTHDRKEEEQFFEFWKEEKQRWDSGNQNPILHEFGDLIAPSKNESREIFIHIPDSEEVENLISEAGFQLVETFYRSDKFNESEEIKRKSGECRFWVAQKFDNK